MLAESRDNPLPAIAYQIIVDAVGAIRLDQQPRNDCVEYDVPRLTEARNLVDVMDGAVIRVAQAQQCPQHLLLPAFKRDVLVSSYDGLPYAKAVSLHPGYE